MVARYIATLIIALTCIVWSSRQESSAATFCGLFNFPCWTTGTRPSTPGIGTTGYNTSLSSLESWSGSVWVLAPNFPFVTSTGTAATGISTRLGRSYNLLDDGGATCDGAANDVAIINTAISAMHTAGGGEVIFPVGKTCAIQSAIKNVYSNVTLRCQAVGSAAPVSAGPCIIKPLGSYTSSGAVSATVSAAGTGVVPGDSLTASGGTQDTTFNSAAIFYVASSKAVTAAVNAPGAGGAPGACTVTGTTGTGTKVQASGTVNGGGQLTGPLTVTVAGSYLINPTLAGEAVTGCGLVGATINLTMGANTIGVQVPGLYSTVPTNPVSTTSSGGGSGTTLTATWGGVMMQVSPASASGAQNTGSSVKGLSFQCDGGSTAAYGLIYQSMRQAEIGWNYFQHCSKAALYLGVIPIGVGNAQQQLWVHNNSYLQSGNTDGNCLWENHSGTGNNSFNHISSESCGYKNAPGFLIVSSDNEMFSNIHMFRAGGGTANGVYITGNTQNASFPANSNRFFSLSAGDGGVFLDGTTNLSTATFKNQFVGYDVSNPVPLPTQDTGATLTLYREDGMWLGGVGINSVFGGGTGDFNAAVAGKVSTGALNIYNGSAGHIYLYDSVSKWRVYSDSADQSIHVGRITGTGSIKLDQVTVGSSTIQGTTGVLAGAVTFATLPGNVAGSMAYITDGAAGNCADGTCTTFGTNVTGGGGAIKLLLWYNGANWTLLGK